MVLKVKKNKLNNNSKWFTFAQKKTVDLTAPKKLDLKTNSRRAVQATVFLYKFLLKKY